MPKVDDRVDEVLFTVDSSATKGDTVYRVCSPNVPGLDVVAPTLKQAIDDATAEARILRRSRGQTGPFNIQLELR